MFIYHLLSSVLIDQNGEIVKPLHLASNLITADKKDRNRQFFLAGIVEECILIADGIFHDDSFMKR